MPRRFKILAGLIVLIGTIVATGFHLATPRLAPRIVVVPRFAPSEPPLTPFQAAVLADLKRQVASNIRYESDYYNDGDPPANVGVCTDVVIRSFRAAGVDLKERVPIDIRCHRSDYDIRHPDGNIDYRRVRDLRVFFLHQAIRLPTKGPNADWEPGDIVIWTTVNSGVPDHIGMISADLDPKGVPMVVHHIPDYPVAEMDWLHEFPIVAHFRWPQAVPVVPPHTPTLTAAKSMNGIKVARST